MRCYVCAGEGGTSEAVAVCSVCGMALCMEHAAREDVESDKRCSLSGEEASGLPRRILCPDCCAVLHGT